MSKRIEKKGNKATPKTCLSKNTGKRKPHTLEKKPREHHLGDWREPQAANQARVAHEQGRDKMRKYRKHTGKRKECGTS